MSFIKYLLINRIWIVIGFNVIAGLFIWFWWTTQGDAKTDTWITAGLVAALNIAVVGVSYFQWKKL